jgi:hypothetical protein
MLVPSGAEPLTHSLLAVIHVVRSYTALSKTLAAPVIAPTRLATFDQHFASCLRTFPPACDPSSSVSLSPQLLNPLVYLLNARMLLHRHNLTPSCAPEVRISAVEQCTHTALETTSLIQRTTSALAEGATAMLAMHLFRCSLFLLLVGHVEPATTLIRALARINDRREVAIPCGRFLAFFASTLASKRSEYASYIARTTPPAHQQPFAPPPRPALNPLQDALLRDEELLVYVSADLQAGADSSWVWAGGEGEASHMSRSSYGKSLASGDAGESTLFSTEQKLGLTEEENRDWGGWDRVESLVRGLASGMSTPTAQAWGSAPPPPPVKMEHGTRPSPGPSSTAGPLSAGTSGGSTGGSPTAATKSRSQERISIANII